VNRDNARRGRHPVTREQLLAFRAKYIEQHGKAGGWRKDAMRQEKFTENGKPLTRNIIDRLVGPEKEIRSPTANRNYKFPEK